MFDAFAVGFGIFEGDTDGEEEFDDEAVAGADSFGEVVAGRCEEDAAVGEGSDEAFALEAGDGFDGSGVGDAQAAGDIDGAGFAAGCEQVGDQFGVVFEQGGRAGAAGFAEAVGLGPGRGAWRRGLAGKWGPGLCPGLGPGLGVVWL